MLRFFLYGLFVFGVLAHTVDALAAAAAAAVDEGERSWSMARFGLGSEPKSTNVPKSGSLFVRYNAANAALYMYQMLHAGATMQTPAARQQLPKGWGLYDIPGVVCRSVPLAEKPTLVDLSFDPLPTGELRRVVLPDCGANLDACFLAFQKEKAVIDCSAALDVVQAFIFHSQMKRFGKNARLIGPSGAPVTVDRHFHTNVVAMSALLGIPPDRFNPQHQYSLISSIHMPEGDPKKTVAGVGLGDCLYVNATRITGQLPASDEGENLVCVGFSGKKPMFIGFGPGFEEGPQPLDNIMQGLAKKCLPAGSTADVLDTAVQQIRGAGFLVRALNTDLLGSIK